MTPKQESFVREYLIDLNASAAYLRAGYKTGNPDVCGPRLLGNVGIREAIQAAMDARSKRTEVTADFVLTGLKEVAERCLQRHPVMVGQGKERKQAVEHVTTDDGEEVLAHVFEFDSAGANRAFELLGKHLKMFTDKQEVEHSGGVSFVLPEQFKDEAEWEAES